MLIRFLLFASYRELAGTEELQLELPPGTSAAEAVAALRSQGEQFQRIPEQPMVAINREYAPLSTPLRSQDELALLPPVAGG